MPVTEDMEVSIRFGYGPLPLKEQRIQLHQFQSLEQARHIMDEFIARDHTKCLIEPAPASDVGAGVIDALRRLARVGSSDKAASKR
jgi:hypothetical protein